MRGNVHPMFQLRKSNGKRSLEKELADLLIDCLDTAVLIVSSLPTAGNEFSQSILSSFFKREEKEMRFFTLAISALTNLSSFFL